MQPLTEMELGRVVGQIELPGIPLLEGEEFTVEDAGIEIDLEVQTSIGSIEWIDDDGLGEGGQPGSLILKGVHIGSSKTPITAEQVRNETPFQPSDLALIQGMLIEADPQAGTLITINKLGDENHGIDLIVNDIYFGADLSEQGIRGTALLVEDISNFVGDDDVENINQLFGLQLSTIDDGMNSIGGNFYPVKLRMTPLEGQAPTPPTFDDINGGLGDGLGSVVGLPGLTDTSMELSAQFVLRVEKLALYRDNFEMGIQGLMVYQGVDTNNDGIEDTIGPATLNNMRLQAIAHPLQDGRTVQAIELSNIDFKADIAMENLYIGNPETGSIGAFFIDDLHISDTKMVIYPHD